MKSTMVMTTTAAFVQRQNKNGAMTLSRRSGLCWATPFVDTKVVESPLSFDSTRTLRYYTNFTAFKVNDRRHNFKMSLLQSYIFTQPQQQHPSDISSIAIPNYQQQIRLMGSKNKESKNQKNKAKQKSMIKKQHLQQEQQKLSSQQQKEQRKQQDIGGDEHSIAVTSATPSRSSGATEQHKEWVEFQKSIEVDGFETGQILTAIDASKKGRSGGKAATKKRLTKRDEMAAKIKERQRLAGTGGAEFPPMRYSDEETERLLKQAYAAIPPRTGRRGTKQLKRQKRRWHLVREIHRKYKQHIMKFHVRRMERRSKKVKEVINFIKNVAPSTVQQDLEYQNMVRQRYMTIMQTAAAARNSETDTTTSDRSGPAVETFESHAA